MNDLTRMQCSEEIVVLGILRVVEEIMLRKPDDKIVINSLLPMIDYRSEDVKMADVVDFKTNPDNSMKKNMEIEKAVKGFVGQKGAQAKSPDSSGGNWKFVKGEKGKENNGGRNLGRMKKRKQKWAKIDGAMEGDNLKKAMERRKKALDRNDKKLRNKRFSDNEKFHPRKPLSPFLPFLKKKALPPVWPAVHLINEKLKEFADKHESVTFFDATSIFAEDVGGGRHHLDNDLISPRGHPSELGFAVWEGRIMGRLDKMFKEMTPPPPVPADPDEGDNDDDLIEGTSDSDANSMNGKEHVSVGKIAVEPAEPMKIPRDITSDVDAEEAEDNDVKEKEEEIDDDESDEKIDSKTDKEDKKVIKEVSAEESADDEEEEKTIDSKAAKEGKKVTKEVSAEESADDEEEEKKIDSKAAKEDEKLPDKATEEVEEEEEEEEDEEEKKIDSKAAKEETKKVNVEEDDGDEEEEE